MVREKIHHPEMRTTYLLKPGQTVEDIRPSERTRALIMTKGAFQRFVDYTTEEDRITTQQEKEAAKVAALKKATYEKSKTWDSKIENIKARQREKLLSKRQKAEEERKMFVKEMAEKKAAERAKVVQQARKLLQQKKPLCRRINRALFASECFRELDAQVMFQNIIKTMDKEQDMEYANSIKTNVAKYEEQKRQEEEEQARKIKDYEMELRKQIEENERDNKLKLMKELETEKQDQRNIIQNMRLIKEKEMQDILNKKKRLQQFFKEAIEEKKRFELELKRNEEFEDRALEIYQKAKDEIQKIQKSITLKEKKKKMREAQIITEKYEPIKIEQIREIKEKEILKKAVEEKEAAEIEKKKAHKEREETMRALLEEYKLRDTAVKTKQKQEEKDLKIWEMMQRFKKNEYDEQFNLEERKRQWQQKLDYGIELQKVTEEKQIEKKREEILEIEATSMKAAIEKANKKILAYGDEVLKESKGVRPLYPILKAIEECKKEMGLNVTKKSKKSEQIDRRGNIKSFQILRLNLEGKTPSNGISYEESIHSIQPIESLLENNIRGLEKCVRQMAGSGIEPESFVFRATALDH
ncbi:golgin subfamily A member 6-like protein 2 [Camponotus floridanus]|uniref:golgin subfamily A member 6-like protein 2 n=1 Tax=Camponotus floridanus TaxID=104421 RepID=UPI000DC6BCD9|nr:golgin subfamily A member 6-like protein 2 [Camponotus floridanus]